MNIEQIEKDYLGKTVANKNGVVSRETHEEYEKKLGVSYLRFIQKGYMYTMDIRGDRLNFELDDDCKIVKVYIG